jgi:hypothetical protein
MLQLNRFLTQLNLSAPSRKLLWLAFFRGLVITVCLTAPIVKSVPSAASETTPQSQVSAEVGFEFPGNRELNQTSITEVEYDGECSGKDSPTIEAKFTSSKTTPADGRRVIVKNVTRGMTSDPYPYINREYHQGRSSESTYMEFGAKHDGKKFRVLDGENQFEYEIKQGDRVIDSGTFTAIFEKVVEVKRRDAVANQESICMNSAVALSVCADIRRQTEYTCPGNRVIRSMLEPNDREISTLVKNQTVQSIVYMLNGEVKQLSAGEDAIFKGNTLSIRFNPTCTTCDPSRTLNLQPGRRYQFKPSQINSSLTELIDFSN